MLSYWRRTLGLGLNGGLEPSIVERAGQRGPVEHGNSRSEAPAFVTSPRSRLFQFTLHQSPTHPDLPSNYFSLFLLAASSDSPHPNVFLCITSPGRVRAPTKCSVSFCWTEWRGRCSTCLSRWGLCFFLPASPGGQSLASRARQSGFGSSLWFTALTLDKLANHLALSFLIYRARVWDPWPPWCVRSQWVHKMISISPGSWWVLRTRH